jgi:hypothetical protein
MCRQRIAWFVLLCAGLVQDATAVEWALTGSLEQQLVYNDNISLNPVLPDSVVGYLLTPELQVSRKTEVLDITLNGQADIRRYDDSRWNCDNYNFGMGNAYRTGRSVFGLRGAYAVSCAYSQQITDTGVLLPNNESENYQIVPSWVWQWTPRDQLILDASYSSTRYTGPGAISSSTDNRSLSFNGSDAYSVNLGANHDWSRLLKLNAKLFFSNIRYTGSNASTQNLFGFQVGADYVIDHSWSIRASGGPRWVNEAGDSSNSVSSGQNNSLTLGSVANISLNYDGQFTRFSGGYSNTFYPSALGQTLQTHSIFLNYAYELTQFVVLDISGNFSQSEPIGGETTDSRTAQFDRTYFTVAAGIAWNVAKNWQLKGSYIYTRQDYQQNTTLSNLMTGVSDSNLLMIVLTYSWPGIHASR